MKGELTLRASSDASVVPTQHDADAAWNRLALQAPQPDPFCATTHWQLSWREAIDPDRPLVVRQHEEGLIQFAQHTLARSKAFGPIERNWLFGCNLLGPAALDLFEGFLAELRGGAAELRCPVVVSGLDPAGALLAVIRGRLSDRYAVDRFRDEVQCAASLERGLDGFLSRRSANLRRNVRRYAKRAAENGVAFERHSPTSAREADRVFARMLAIELTSWKGLDRCGMESPSMTRFYSTMLRRLSRSGDARVIFATRDDGDIGFIFGGMAGGIYRGQQFSFDERHASLSIGSLMQFEQIRWLCEEGAHRYDLGPLLGPSMEYKHYWTDLQLPIEAWIVRVH